MGLDQVPLEEAGESRRMNAGANERMRECECSALGLAESGRAPWKRRVEGREREVPFTQKNIVWHDVILSTAWPGECPRLQNRHPRPRESEWPREPLCTWGADRPESAAGFCGLGWLLWLRVRGLKMKPDLLPILGSRHGRPLLHPALL